MKHWIVTACGRLTAVVQAVSESAAVTVAVSPSEADRRFEMMVTIRVQPSKQGGKDEYVRLVEIATMSEILAELTATARHYARVRDQHHRATARLSCGKVLATVGVSPDARPFDPREGVRKAAA